MTKLSGYLKDGAGNALSLCKIEFIAIKNSLSVITQSNAETMTDKNGAYDIDLSPCAYSVYITKQTRYRLGTIQIYADSKGGTLNEYLTLLNCNELSPEIISKLNKIRDEIEQFSIDTKKSSESARRSESNARDAESSAKNLAEASAISANNAAQSANNAETSTKQASEAAQQAKAEAARIINLNPVLSVNDEKPDEQGNINVKTGIDDAPKNNKQYARVNEAWTETVSSVNGATGDIEINYHKAGRDGKPLTFTGKLENVNITSGTYYISDTFTNCERPTNQASPAILIHHNQGNLAFQIWLDQYDLKIFYRTLFVSSTGLMQKSSWLECINQNNIKNYCYSLLRSYGIGDYQTDNYISSFSSGTIVKNLASYSDLATRDTPMTGHSKSGAVHMISGKPSSAATMPYQSFLLIENNNNPLGTNKMWYGTRYREYISSTCSYEESVEWHEIATADVFYYYPNGSDATPPELSSNERLALSTAVIGYKKKPDEIWLEVLYNGIWSKPYFANGAGAMVNMTPTLVIIQTGVNGVIPISNLSGNVFNLSAPITSNVPYRIALRGLA